MIDPITIGSVLGLVFPPLFDFVKKKFLKQSEDTPEATLNTLATTKPDQMPAYVTALAGLFDAKTRYFNRDVVGALPIWISALRASIRPISVIASLGLFIAAWRTHIPLPPDVAGFMAMNISSWFGDRLL